MKKRESVIVHIGKYYPPYLGGIENNTRQIAEATSKIGKSYVICMRSKPGKTNVRIKKNVVIIEVGILAYVSRQGISYSILPLLRRLKPDCLHFHSPNPLFAFYLEQYLKINPNIPVIVSHHGDLLRPYFVAKLANYAYLKILRKSKAIITYTKYAANISNEIKPFLDKLHVIPHGFDVSDRLNENRALRDVSVLNVGYLGRLEYWKGVQVLIKSISEMQDVELFIAGKGSYEKNLKELVGELSSLNKVQFMGELKHEDKSIFFDLIDVLVLPSLNNNESFGQVLVEAQLSGIPVIASDLPTGIQSIIQNSVTGVLFPPGDSYSLAGEIERMKVSSYRDFLSSNAYLHAYNSFSVDVVLDMLYELYARVLDY